MKGRCHSLILLRQYFELVTAHMKTPQPSLQRPTSSRNTVIWLVLPTQGLTTRLWCLTKGPLSFLGLPQHPYGDLMMTSLTSAKYYWLIIPEIMRWRGQNRLVVGVREEARWRETLRFGSNNISVSQLSVLESWIELQCEFCYGLKHYILK